MTVHVKKEAVKDEIARYMFRNGCSDTLNLANHIFVEGMDNAEKVNFLVETMHEMVAEGVLREAKTSPGYETSDQTQISYQLT